MFERYPEMAAIGWSEHVKDSDRVQSKEISQKLHREYKKLVKKGVKYESATEQVLNKYQDHLDEILIKLSKTQNLAESQNAVRFTDFIYQQQL